MGSIANTPSLYNDGWRYGSRSMWMEDTMNRNWMNITVLREYTFPSGRLKPRTMTKLSSASHARAMKYIKRLRRMGLMPFHRLQSKMLTDDEAQNPRAISPSPFAAPGAGGTRPAMTREVSKDVLGQIDSA